MRRAAKAERAGARGAGSTIPTLLEQQAAARENAVRRHTAEVVEQRRRDAVEIPGLSSATLIALEHVRVVLAIDQRLDEEGKRDASRAAGAAGGMRVPGAGPEHQAGVDLMARCFVISRNAREKTEAWGNRVAREQDRQRQGLATREGLTRGRGLDR